MFLLWCFFIFSGIYCEAPLRSREGQIGALYQVTLLLLLLLLLLPAWQNLGMSLSNMIGSRSRNISIKIIGCSHVTLQSTDVRIAASVHVATCCYSFLRPIDCSLSADHDLYWEWMVVVLERKDYTAWSSMHACTCTHCLSPGQQVSNSTSVSSKNRMMQFEG